jgi:hypothetical protein
MIIFLNELEIHISYPWEISGSITLQNVLKYADFRRSTTTITKGIIFCDMTSFSLLVHRRFGKTYCMYLQGSRVNQGSKKQVAIEACFTLLP